MGMAEVLVSAVMEMLIQKLLSSELINFARSEQIDSKLNKWKKTLPMIKALLADAAQRQIQDEAVKLWLIDLQHLAYDIDDVLDDIATEAMNPKFQESWASSSSSSSSSMLLNTLPTCCINFTPRNFMYGRSVSSKLDDITNKMHDLFEQRNDLGLKLNVKVERSNKTDVRFHQTSLIDESKVMGREGDKETLVGKLLGGEEACRNQNVSVVSIVGMGGIGKTTLAGLLYNDQKVKDHFKLRAWVCVSDDFDVFGITKQIYQAVGGENREFDSLDQLQIVLKEKLSKNRFLLVLDDVWNEHYDKWERLERPLVGAPGSKVIVTTRKTKVAYVMNSVECHNVEVLSDEMALSLFAQYALDEQNFDKHPSLKLIAQGIIKKCDGLPLALITLGRVLKTKGSADEWTELLNSEIWNLQDESDILPALKLSYYDLPPHLKLLFAYCSLFPKDYVFEKNKLVMLWMSEGFLSQTKGNKTMESLGRQYFEELLSRSFFQRSTNYESEYMMHDLMNDLAISVAGEFFFMWDDKRVNDESFEKLRHCSFTHDAQYTKLKNLHKARCLRTFISVSGGWYIRDNVIAEVLPHLHFLRVLSLTDMSITKVPQSIGNLKHLGYLNFSKSRIKQLPKHVSDLYNLQSLLVRDCSILSNVPVSFVKLINLRHLDMGNTPLLRKTPLGIGKSTSLQTVLPKVFIKGGNGFNIVELNGLSKLQGGLSIKGLDKVIDPKEATDANLQQKEGLDDLDMEWSDAFDCFRNPTIEYDVLESLRAPSELKKLSISFYGGMKFPSWLGNPTSFHQLTELTLKGCQNCTNLPTLGHLSSLRKLCLSSMKTVKTLGFELLAPAKPLHCNAFPLLESLEVHNMQSLETWSTSGGDNDGARRSFLSLGVISIKKCPKLAKVSFGLIPSLKDLKVEECPEAVLRDLVRVSSSIRRLNLYTIKGLTQIDREVFKHLGAVEDLRIWGCDELRYLWESESEACRFLGSLQQLEVNWCDKLESIKGEKEAVNVESSSMGSLKQVTLRGCDSLESYNCPNYVVRLKIRNCDSMTSLILSNLRKEPQSSSSSSSSSLSSSLKFLDVMNCKNIKSISQEHLQSLASLEEMWINKCPSMEYSFPSCGLWPSPNLKTLWVGELKKPMYEWGLQNYPISLVELILDGKDSGVVSFGITGQDHTTTSSTCFLLPPSLTELWIWNFEEMESVSEVLQHLPHLQLLSITNCPKLRDVPESTSSLTVFS